MSEGRWHDALRGWLGDLDLGTTSSGSAGAPLRELRAVPKTVTVAGATARVAAYLNRDFMPICPPDGHPLVAIVRVFAEPAVLPPTVRADRIVVVYGDEVWVAPLVEEHPEFRDESVFEVIARQGPKWDAGESVDVVVQLRDGAGKEYLVGAPSQLIEHSM
jgi:hypothetical protein